MTKKKPLVAILGCGPSGLLAAHACHSYEIPYVIFSQLRKSQLGGAQYSHIPIPGIHDDDDPDVKLKYVVRGDAETYQRKVYGSETVPFVSFENVYDGKLVPAWNLRKMYDHLWVGSQEKIVDFTLDPINVSKLPHSFDYVFSSVPLPTICFGRVDPAVQHWFKQQTVRILNEPLAAGMEDNTIIYDGTDEHSWYRMSKIFGVGSTEWGGSGAVPPIPDLKTVDKPIATNCDCHQADFGGGIPAVIKIGRFGTWQKGELTFHAFNKVLDVLAKGGAIS